MSILLLSIASYDICKNNEHVAQLTFLKTSFRVGESISGMIDFSKSTIPCYQVSFFLESNEVIEVPFAVKNKATTSKLARRVVDEHHEFCLNTKKTFLKLTFPVAATPDFVTSVGEYH